MSVRTSLTDLPRSPSAIFRSHARACLSSILRERSATLQVVFLSLRRIEERTRGIGNSRRSVRLLNTFWSRGHSADDFCLFPIPVDADPMAYTGKLRIATGLACLHGMQSVETRMHELRLPFKVIHGTSDRATNWRGSQKLYDTAISTDKAIKLVQGAEHILLRAGHDADDDKPRQEVLAEMLDWLDRH